MDGALSTRTALLVGWLVLLGASVALFALVALAAWWQHRREVPSRARRRAELSEWERHAGAVAGCAEQAAARAAVASERLAVAERSCAAAWQEFEAVQAAYEQSARRYEEAQRRSAAAPVDPSGQQVVAHAALAAYRRGDLSQEQLWRVWSWGTGWDPELAEREQELRRLRAARREAQLRYRTEASRQRAALAESQVAEVQARALAEEAATAAEQAGVARWSG
jgi:hypothetical protein